MFEKLKLENYHAGFLAAQKEYEEKLSNLKYSYEQGKLDGEQNAHNEYKNGYKTGYEQGYKDAINEEEPKNK